MYSYERDEETAATLKTTCCTYNILNRSKYGTNAKDIWEEPKQNRLTQKLDIEKTKRRFFGFLRYRIARDVDSIERHRILAGKD